MLAGLLSYRLESHARIKSHRTLVFSVNRQFQSEYLAEGTSRVAMLVMGGAHAALPEGLPGIPGRFFSGA